ncbi:MAG: efflux RND transporter periplasmic adaptor subunit [Proteobacteria bacterium]|nr:efflux RND transporter periplasmic adaptor subunit [Pseudomonadota bacterium]
MRNVTHSLVLVLVFAATGCSSHDGSHQEDHKDHEGHEDHADHKDGHSADEEPGTVHLTEPGQRRSGIRLGTVKSESLVGGVHVPAEVQLNPDRVAHITPMYSGQVGSVKVSLGDEVKKGQVLVTLRSVALGEARAELSRATGAVDLAVANFERQQKLRDEGIGSKRNLLEAQGELRRARAELAAARDRLQVYGGSLQAGASVSIRSPLAGVIIERHATPGEVVGTDRPMFVVADTSRVWIAGRVYEQDVAAARLGASARITLQAFPGRSWTGSVEYVGRVLDEHSRTLPIRVELDNSAGELRAGLFADIALSPPGVHTALVASVPEEAVVNIGDQPVVFVPGGGPGEFRSVPVSLGSRSGGLVELRTGPGVGDNVVVAGAFTLKSELLRAQMSDGHAH